MIFFWAAPSEALALLLGELGTRPGPSTPPHQGLAPWPTGQPWGSAARRPRPFRRLDGPIPLGGALGRKRTCGAAPVRGAMEAAEERGLASDSLEAFLLDFDHAVRDFEQRVSSRPQPPLQALKTGLRGSLYDSGSDDSGSKSVSPSSSLNSSQEDLGAGVASPQTPCSTAKLGDTRELEAFIADLDQILKEM